MPKIWSKFFLVSIAAITTLWFACNVEKTSDKLDPVLAQVYNKTLVLSDIDGIVPHGQTPKDSLHWLQSFVDRWVAEAILMHEAESHVSQDLDVDKLVRDYRSSLILSNYEQELFGKELNKVITDKDVQSYFSSHKEQFRLSYDIVRYLFAKADISKTEKVVFEKWWDTGNDKPTKPFLQYLKANAVYVDDQIDRWAPLKDLQKELPKRLADTLSRTTDVMLENNNYLYCLKIYETGKRGNMPPISFVRDQVEKIILHGRKMKLLEDKKSALYQKEKGGDNVKIFTN